ncbi:glycoside hydrolase family 3 protein [Treponema parvum]|uniref:glycoside hydrolase family 3 protein n=1 Tax=Treponema parvum TaxID=138851 RepID=UPI001AEC1428|nr:glycoside hydrolase family 3 protein [Treponema parvum]QTQ16063.1 glycoside hydrolase family 3 protein [Treponema parvum]
MKKLVSLNIEGLSIDQKIGLMLFMRNPIDAEDLDFTLDMIRNHSLGGIHLSFRYVHENYYCPGEKYLLGKVLENADYPILIGDDMEYGFNYGKIELPYQMAVASTDNLKIAYEYGRITGVEAKKGFYNTVFGPIMDIAALPLSSCVGSRAYADTKEKVSKFSVETIKGYQDQGMVVTGKHYPGFGYSTIDSHIGMVYLDADEKTLIDRELFPYLEAIKNADLSGIMVGHIMVPNIDSKYPATLSKKIVDVIRKQGYDGLMITDSFAMIGLTNKFGLETCHQLAMAAGIDMVLTSYRISCKEAYTYMLDAYKKGIVSEEQINEAARRVIAAQNRTLKSPDAPDISEEDRSAVLQMSVDAVTDVKKEGVSSKLSDGEDLLFVFQKGNLYEDFDTGELKKESYDFTTFEKEIKANYPKASIVYLPEFPARNQQERFMATTMNYSRIVMVLATKNESYRGTSDIPRRMLSMMEGLEAKLVCVILSGCPYASREFMYVPRIIYAYDGQLCQKTAVDVLSGKKKAKGILPVNLIERKIMSEE